MTYRRLGSHPEGVHRTKGVLFDQAVDDGCVDIKDHKLVRELTGHCRDCGAPVDYEIALERYGVGVDDQGREVAPSVPGVIEVPGGVTTGLPSGAMAEQAESITLKKRGRPKGR